MVASTPALENVQPGSVAILGLPFDEHSSFLRGAALGPTHIRAAFHSPSANLTAENGIDFAADTRLHDLGDLIPNDNDPLFSLIQAAVTRLLEHDLHPLLLGGDHAITYPVIQAFGHKYKQLNILHIDAHPDLYDSFEGSRHSHACPFARIMEEKLASRLVQVGIRTMTPHQRDQAERFGVEVIEMRSWKREQVVEFSGPTYLSLDLDALDPAYAPGVSHHEPGGFSTREVLHMIHQLRVPLVGADIVELNPTRDPQGITAMTAAKFLKEIAAKMLD